MINSSRTKSILYSILFLFFFADFSYSFVQHLSQPLDGDIAHNVVPSEYVKPVLESPLGLKAIITGENYVNPNRFFCHWIQREYLLKVPLSLQNYKDPIESVYLSSAIFKTIVQALLIYLIAACVTGSLNILSLDFIVAATMVFPFFQTNGYRSYMGIIDPSITYSMFYALPLLILIVYLMPLILKIQFNKDLYMPFYSKVLWVLLSIVVCLSGPLNPGIVLVMAILVFIKFFFESNQSKLLPRLKDSISLIPSTYRLFFIPLCLFSIYSLFLGRYNSMSQLHDLSLVERYFNLPSGLYYQFTQKLGYPILLISLAFNAFIIKRFYSDEKGKNILATYKWIGLFAIFYILLLPFGGYRDYRPNVMRYDTILPITISCIYLFSLSSLFLFKKINSKRYLSLYTTLVVAILLIFTNADKAEFQKNECEKDALQVLANSESKTVALEQDCTVLSWQLIGNAADSELNAELLLNWNITKSKTLYFNNLNN